MTRDEARDMLVQSIENEATHDAAVKLREINQRLKDESEQTAREIISTAIQRCAADQVSEATVSVVPLPNDEMKGRIIGREGRNIRTLETLTGVDSSSTIRPKLSPCPRSIRFAVRSHVWPSKS